MSEKYWLDKMNENPRYREIWEKIKELPFNETTEIILDLETKLVEKDELLENYRQFVGELSEKLGNVDCEYKTQIFTLKRTLIDECKEHRDFCRIADEKIKGLEQQLVEKRKKVVQEIRKWCKENFDYTKLPNEFGCWVAVNREEFFNVLDQIQGDDNNENKRN